MAGTVRSLARQGADFRRGGPAWARPARDGFPALLRTSCPGHKGSFPPRSKILPRRPDEGQLSGDELSLVFGPARPGAAIDISGANGYPVCGFFCLWAW